MSKRLIQIISIVILMSMVGCTFTWPFGQDPDGAVATSVSNLETLAAAAESTLAAEATSDGILRLPTPTSTPGAYGGDPLVTDTVVTATASAGAIRITGVEEIEAGLAVVRWEADGDFPSGFKVVWTDVQSKPTFPENDSVYASSSTARSAQISGDPGKIYYVRVCRYANNLCDVYSDLAIFGMRIFASTPISNLAMTQTKFAMTQGTATKTPLKTPIPGTGKTFTPTKTGLPGITINSITYWGGNKAKITWTANNTGTYGFKILYSKTTTTPTFGTSSYFAIGDSKAREAYIEGLPGTTYYYRICRYTGTTCDTYSNSYQFTWPGTAYTPTKTPTTTLTTTKTPTPTATTDVATITITDVEDTAPNMVKVSWDVTGDFPDGFKLFYSTTEATPDLSNSDYLVISNGAVREYNLSGIQNTLYYIRLCKISAGGCSNYSDKVTHTFLPDPPEITITNIEDDTTLAQAIMDWDATGFFDDGFIIVRSTTVNPPTDADDIQYLSDGTLRQETIDGEPGEEYFYRICQAFNATTCDTYSTNTYTFTFAESPEDSLVTLVVDGVDPAQFDMEDTNATPNADGYRLMFKAGSIVDLGWTDMTGYEVIPTTTATTTTGTYTFTSLTTGTYTMRVCLWNTDGYCNSYSNPVETIIP